MHARSLVLPSFLLVLASSATQAPAAAVGPDQGASVRGPDAHVIQRPRGDIIIVQSEADDVRAGVRPYVPPFRNARYAVMRPGDRLRPAFYAPRYVVADPGLRPQAGTNRCWVRYFDDLLLVDRRTGRVLRVKSKRLA